ncbi:hypothetical protein G7Z17_g7594 [Cylindrodendrum hubeiense]|uniref:DUF676 domain-containing protein n=1 Tax=Cylindrodendrum hubeiense TaxID=595255 RepID=A0A9P5HB47_9HYPO|nr:hypothetical protein G7Z17_g7594 [Cylindrodendrum hubeiense]
MKGFENRAITRYETTTVYKHPEATVDIVLVHGLNGSPDKTWTAKNGVFWPLDLLPASLKDVQANIMVYGYNADVYSKQNDQSASDNFIHQHAQTLIANLTFHRRSEGTFQNPIIWVAHSLGGILVKKALLYSNDVRAEHHEHYRSIYVSTFGLVFLGTPHTGADGATWGLMLQGMADAILPKKFFESESVLLRTLKKENETLSNINSHFLDIYQRFRIHMAHENHKSDLKATKALVVDFSSASPQLPGVTYYGIEATHSGMCKFDSPSAPGWRNVSTDIRQWVIDAPAMIQVRWEVEEEERRARLRNEMNERFAPFGGSFTGPSAGPSASPSANPSIGPSTSPSTGQHAGPSAGPSNPQTREHANQESLTLIKDQAPSSPIRLDGIEPSVSQNMNQPLFIHPDQFRPNSHFRGRENELNDLHRMLMDQNRRDQGTSAVLIWAVPGGGKSHLAREYAFRHQHDYPGGIFWIRGKAQEDLEDGFLKMAKSASFREYIRVKDKSDLKDPSRAIHLVRKWLNRSENWLLILDGVLSDTRGLSKYIPDARNTSLILTSTDTSIAGDHQFDSPRKLELGPLSEEDAQIMLLEVMDKRKPWSRGDLSRALETVRLMECLPLAIHAAGRQLRTTREPLAKYIRAYKNRPRTGGLEAYNRVRVKLQERGETAALNLMYLLSFFSARIPVEMLGLGLKALDNRTPVRTPDLMGEPSLTKTFTVLIAFALIERDEIEDAPSSTASSPDSSQPNPTSTELLDMLKIHSVVQTFFRETLKEENQFEFWLERAAAVFCKSFDNGDTRARRNPDVGLPDDYRRYAAHARKILEHISRVERPTAELRAAGLALQSRLGDIQGLVSTMSSTMTTTTLESHGKDPHVSIFERTNSLSIPSSVTSTASRNERPRDIGQQGLRDQQSSLPTLEEDLHHTHVPYPQQSPFPVPEFPHYEDPGNWDTSSSKHGAQDVLETHRTVRWWETKKYRDRAGAWRETKTKVNEPRASINRDIEAFGQFSAAVPTLANARGETSSPVFTDAWQHLAHLKNARQRGLGEADPKRSEVQRSGVGHERSILDEDFGRVENKEAGGLKGNRSPPMSKVLKVQSRAQLPYHSQDAFDEHTFSETGGFGTGSNPYRHHHDNGEWRSISQDGYSRRLPTSHSDSCLDTEVDQWAPSGLPIVISSTSTLSPATHHHRPFNTHHKARDSGYAGEAFSNSLPSSQGSTLQPQPWRPSTLNPDGYSSQPLSRNPSSNHDMSTAEYYGPTSGSTTSQNLLIRAPSATRTEPSPRIGGFESVPATSYQAYQQRHPGPWSSEQHSQRDSPRVVSSPVSDGVEMVRSGSGGIQFNGRIVEFGQSPLGASVYPLEIAESDSLWWEDDIPTPGKRPTGLGIVRENHDERGALQ